MARQEQAQSIRDAALTELAKRGSASMPQQLEIKQRLTDKDEGLTKAFKSVVGGLDLMASIASGVGSEIIGGLTGIGTLTRGGTPQQAAQTAQAMQSNLTYNPMSGKGKEYQQDLGQLMQPVGEAISNVESNLGNKTLEATGSPFLATMAHTVPTALMELTGLKAAKTLAQPVNNADLYSPKIFAGQMSNTFPNDKLNSQESLNYQNQAHQTPRGLWERTGIYKDADGKLKYEIDDSQSTFDTDAFINTDAGRAERNPDYEPFSSRTTRGLPSVLDHPELFEAYPQLRNFQVRVEPNMPAGTRGAYNERSGTVDINPNIINDPEQVRSTVMHELQHGVQGIEDFARGGNEFLAKRAQKELGDKSQADENYLQWATDDAKPVIDKRNDLLDTGYAVSRLKDMKWLKQFSESDNPTQSARLIHNRSDFYLHADDIRSQYGAEPKKHRPKHERAEWLRNAARYLATKQSEKITPEQIDLIESDKRQLTSQEKYYTREANKLEESPEFKEMRNREKALRRSSYLNDLYKDKNLHTVYEGLLGEVEARNVQNRLDMTQEQRAKSFPPSTQTISDFGGRKQPISTKETIPRDFEGLIGFY